MPDGGSHRESCLFRQRGVRLLEIVEALLQPFWQMCLLRSGPQSLPASPLLLVIAGGANVAAGAMVAASLTPLTFSGGLMLATVVLLLLGGLTFIILWIRVKKGRWVQTVTALAGSEAVIYAYLVPVGVFARAVAGGQGPLMIPVVLAVFAALLWLLLVFANILRHALSVPLALGGIFAGFYLFLTVRVSINLFFVE